MSGWLVGLLAHGLVELLVLHLHLGVRLALDLWTCTHREGRKRGEKRRVGVSGAGKGVEVVALSLGRQEQ